MHIGELASKASVNVQTIRFYERQGLLPSPQRNQAGYRLYDTNDLDRVNFVKKNQELGFTLDEIKQLMDLHNVVTALPKPFRRKPNELQGIISLGQERLHVIDHKIRTLQKMRRQLISMLQQLEAPVVTGCPVSQATSLPPSAKCPGKSS